MTIIRGQDPINRTLTVTWLPPPGPKNFVGDCMHEYIATLSRDIIDEEIITHVIPGRIFWMDTSKS